MLTPDSKRPATHDTAGPVEQLIQHLFYNPSDLIDSCRLMRRFRVSAADFQRALIHLEHLRPAQDEILGCEQLSR